MELDLDEPQWQPQPQPTYIDPSRKLLDLVFIQDCTGSQGSYINSATRNIEEIYQSIFQSQRLSSPEDLRIGLIAFRDHPPQDHTYVTKNFGFSSDPAKVKQHLEGLYAAGGGDGPEAVTAALGEALAMDWRPHASKMVVLIADAPPHGIGEYGDGFSDGSPDGRDPLQIAREMASKGITLFFVACEPALSGYLYATDFYQAITGITSGLMLPLTTANLLAHAIIGSVLENLDMERLIREVGQAVAERILGGQESVDDVARELHEKLLLRNENTKKLVIENIYKESEEAKHNVRVWTEAPDIRTAKGQLKKVKGPRFTDKFLQVGARSRTSAYSSTGPPLLPARGGTRTPPPMGLVSPPTSPSSRQIPSSFPTFSASPGATSSTVLGTAIAGGNSAFGSFSTRPNAFGTGGIRRTRKMDMDDDDDDDDNLDPFGRSPRRDTRGNSVTEGGQKIELREGGITFEQARRIAMQSAWRGVGS